MSLVNPGRKRSHWQMIVLALFVLLFLSYSLPPYTSLNPTKSRIPVPEKSTSYYIFLVAHIAFATIAMITATLQVWPWLRDNYPKVHRISGRIYIFGGVVPAGLAGFYVAAHFPFGLPAGISTIMLDILWISFTLTGFRMVLKRNFKAHRKWMIRSFALTMSIILNRLIVFPVVLLATAVNTPNELMPFTIAGVVTWVSWTTALLIAEAYLARVNYYSTGSKSFNH